MMERVLLEKLERHKPKPKNTFQWRCRALPMVMAMDNGRNVMI